jgi:hypothetical protein
MSLLAEEIVEEWLNRQGYFTLRGVRLGVHEIDLLALRQTETGLDRRHIEVQASVRPMSYVTDLPKAVQKKTGRKPKSTKQRSADELKLGVEEWVFKKWDLRDKVKLRAKLAAGQWSRELVVHLVKHEHELDLLRQAGVTILRLRDIVHQLKSGDGMVLEGAAGAHLLDLVALGAS